VLLTWQKNFASLSSSRYCTDRAQNLPGPAPTMYSERSRFHDNQFTFSRVIAERMNTAKTCRKVNPTFRLSLEQNNNTKHATHITWYKIETMFSQMAVWINFSCKLLTYLLVFNQYNLTKHKNLTHPIFVCFTDCVNVPAMLFLDLTFHQPQLHSKQQLDDMVVSSQLQKRVAKPSMQPAQNKRACYTQGLLDQS